MPNIQQGGMFCRTLQLSFGGLVDCSASRCVAEIYSGCGNNVRCDRVKPLVPSNSAIQRGRCRGEDEKFQLPHSISMVAGELIEQVAIYALPLQVSQGHGPLAATTKQIGQVCDKLPDLLHRPSSRL